MYRIAHELYVQDVPLIPRIMSEYAHGRTGVDINSGATIGEYFFIGHATGVVIGETTTIGNHVKVYQGVTLGALSTRAGQALSGVKRHPPIEDDVTIYSNASVLGGETVIGEGSIIAGSAFVISSVPAGSRVSLKNQEVNVRTPNKDHAKCWEIYAANVCSAARRAFRTSEPESRAAIEAIKAERREKQFRQGRFRDLRGRPCFV